MVINDNKLNTQNCTLEVTLNTEPLSIWSYVCPLSLSQCSTSPVMRNGSSFLDLSRTRIQFFTQERKSGCFYLNYKAEMEAQYVHNLKFKLFIHL
jgi:hypothetical protein